MTTKTSPEGDKLDALFQVVVDEANANARFADKLRAALGTPHTAPTPDTAKEKNTKTAATPDLHAVNVLRQHGERMLRGRLSQLRTKADLLGVARRSGLRLTGKSAQKSATRPDLIDGIVEAAQQYDRQRGAADG